MTWDEQADTWDDDPAVIAYSNAAYASLRAVLDEAGLGLTGTRILDFGCGTGRLTSLIAEQAADVVGYDISEPMVTRLAAKALANVQPVSGPLDAVGDRFDGVTCSSVCAFVPDYPATVLELAQRLAPSGWFIQWDWELDAAADEPFGLSRDAIHQALVGAGLQDVQVRTGFQVSFGGHIMAPVMGFGRMPRRAPHR